jgi:hypothetical protein
MAFTWGMFVCILEDYCDLFLADLTLQLKRLDILVIAIE